jgi:alkyl hydroperoxide reductase subunit AhpC
MVELGQLEARHEEFAKRGVRVVAASIEATGPAQQTQADFPHLTIVADESRGLANAVALLHPRSAPDGGETAAPTVMLVDRQGVVRWIFRPGRHIERLAAGELVEAVDREMGR